MIKLAQCHIFISSFEHSAENDYTPAAFPRSPRRRGAVNPCLYASKLISPSSITLAEGRRWAQPCSPGTIDSLGTRKTKVLHQVNQLVAQSKTRKHPVDRKLRKVTTWSENLVKQPHRKVIPKANAAFSTNVSAEASDAAGPPATPRWRQLRWLRAPDAGPSSRRPVFERFQYPLR